jgi:hypothetical protein
MVLPSGSPAVDAADELRRGILFGSPPAQVGTVTCNFGNMAS